MTHALHMESLLRVRDLSITFRKSRLSIPVVDHLNLTIERGEILGLVGESGSGKSVTALTIAGLLSGSATVKVEGKVLLRGREARLTARENNNPPARVGMIFQDPFDSLNPAYTIGYQIQEVFRELKGLGKRQAWSKTLAMLDMVQIPSPSTVAAQYPHQLSGGMCQRVMIAMALAAEPELLIADEPTTALDVTVQARILRLLYQLHRDTGTSILFITHDLAVVAQFCHSVAIMLEGEIVEQGSTAAIFKQPLHPYTQGLLNSIPVLGKSGRLHPMAPAPNDEMRTEGCRYYSRCPVKIGRCRKARSPLMEHGNGHSVRCDVVRGQRV